MAIEQYYQEVVAAHEADGEDASSLQRWKSGSTAEITTEKANGCFDCNICLDSAQDPVVTLCGHLYCWPCIYKWLYFESTSVDLDQQQRCPVCKADVSHSALVPLYGRGGHHTPGQTETEPKGGPHLDLVVPRRPPACGVHALITTTSTASHPGRQHHHHHHQHHNHPYPAQPQTYYHQQYYPNYSNYASASQSPAMLSLGGTTMMNLFHPIVGMFGEMINERMFGNSSNSLYPYQNSYSLRDSRPRMRRQEMQADKSLNRISIFLFCCFVLCLLLF